VPVLTWADRQVNVLILKHEVSIRRGDQDLSVPQALAVVCRVGREGAGARQNFGEHTGAVGGDVKDDANSGR
jgi:hypothetical protein